jgi:beta-fructofuranosidase
LLTGTLTGNGSHLDVDPHHPTGLVLDYGFIYAGQCLYDTSQDRQLYFGWVTGGGHCGSLCKNNTWGSVISLPRVLALSDTGVTWDIAPELQQLRTLPAAYARANFTLAAGAEQRLDLAAGIGEAIEIRLLVASESCGDVVVGVRATADRSEQTYIAYSDRTGLAVCTVSLAPPNNDRLPQQPACINSPPQDSTAGGVVSMRIFVDASVVETHVGARTSVTQRVYPTRDDARGVYIANRGSGVAEVVSMEVWEMKGIYDA